VNRRLLTRRPLIHYHTQVIELLDGGFDLAANFRPRLFVGQRRFFYGYDAAVGPGAFGQRDQRVYQVGLVNLNLLAAGGCGSQKAAFAEIAGIGVGLDDAQVDHLRVEAEEGIGPGTGFVYVYVAALGGNGDFCQICALLVFFREGGLGLMFRGLRPAGDFADGLFFFAAAGEKRERQEKCVTGTSISSPRYGRSPEKCSKSGARSEIANACRPSLPQATFDRDSAPA